MGYISLPSNLNGIIGMASYYCVILKIMTLHIAIKTIKKKVFPFSLKKTKSCFFLKKQTTRVFLNLDYYTHGIVACRRLVLSVAAASLRCEPWRS